MNLLYIFQKLIRKLKLLIRRRPNRFKLIAISLLFLLAGLFFHVGINANKPKPEPSPSPLEASKSESKEEKEPSEETLESSPKSETKSVSKPSIKGTGTVSLEGKWTNFTATFPKEGGNISISGEGICAGSGSGTFQGGSSTVVSGTLSGTCDNLISSGTFSGNIYLKEGRANGTWEGKGNGYTKNGNWAFTFNPTK